MIFVSSSASVNAISVSTAIISVVSASTVAAARWIDYLDMAKMFGRALWPKMLARAAKMFGQAMAKDVGQGG
jgi:hypothetical protein